MIKDESRRVLLQAARIWGMGIVLSGEGTGDAKLSSAPSSPGSGVVQKQHSNWCVLYSDAVRSALAHPAASLKKRTKKET